MPAYPQAPTNGLPPNEISGAASSSWTQLIAEALNRVLGGKLNVTLKFTLGASQTSTTIIDSRISAANWLGLQPLSADAAAALGGCWWSAQTSGSATLSHANTASLDRTFNLLIIG